MHSCLFAAMLMTQTIQGSTTRDLEWALLDVTHALAPHPSCSMLARQMGLSPFIAP